jgi:hypothetical protein
MITTNQFVVLAALLLSPLNSLSAAVIFETAHHSADRFSSGVVLVSADHMLGVKFRLTEPTRVESVGGRFYGDGSIFAAIVALTFDFDLPDSSNLSTPDVLGATLIQMQPVNAPFAEDVSGPLNLTLQPGSYALMFGSRYFGSTATGGNARYEDDTDIGSPRYFRWADSAWRQDGRFADFRFFIEGEVVPEPSSLALILCAAPGLLFTYVRVRRLRT